MSIPLVRNNTKDAINTSIIAIKKNLERINSLLGLADSSEPDLSGLATKQELDDAVTEINNTIDEVETSLQPVDTVTSGNMHSVTSGAVYSELVDGGNWTSFANEDLQALMWYKKVGKTIFLHINGSGLNFNSSGGNMLYQASGNTVFLDHSIRPQRSTNFMICDNTSDSAIHIRLLPEGNIQGWSNPNIDIRTITNWQIDICYRLD
jgi:hypothetical protein